MRTNLIVCIILALSMILCPVAALGNSEDKTPEKAVTQSETENTTKKNYISVMTSSTGQINSVEMREYIIGCVAAEISPLYHTQAIKAQAVASYTYAKRTTEKNKNAENNDIKGADITDNPDTHQGYITKAERQKKWGDKFEEYEKKISDAVDEVAGYYMSYNGETVLAAYHSISSGKTRSAESLWKSEIPYLVSVESQGDKLSPEYISKHKFSKDEFEKNAEKCGVTLNGDAKEWVKKITRDDNGYVSSVTVDGEKISASDFRNAFDLKSGDFEIEYTDGGFIITCKGYGHGVGMSQYGADYMARQGSSWQEILMHYYSGIKIEKE